MVPNFDAGPHMVIGWTGTGLVHIDTQIVVWYTNIPFGTENVGGGA